MSTTAGLDPVSFLPGAPPVLPSGDAEPQLVLETRQQIRLLVQEITKLSESDVSLGEFYDGLLTRVVSALAATGGAVWSMGSEGRLELAYRINLDAAAMAGTADVRHTLLLKRVMRDGQPLAAPPRSGFPDDAEAGNPTDQLLLLAPIAVEQEVAGVIEVLQRPGAGPTTQRGYLRFLAQMSELSGNFLRNHRLRLYAERAAMWQKLERMLAELHRSLDLPATSYAVVNEAKRVIECERVSLALMHGQRCRLVAVSGLDNIDRRTEQATLLARLVDAVLPAGESFWHGGEESLRGVMLAPQIEGPLNRYVDKSHTKAIGILPILWSDETPAPQDARRTQRVLGALVLERMSDDRWTQSHKTRAATVLQFATPALAHALEFDRVLLRSLWTWLGNGRARLDTSARLKIAAAAAVLVGAGLALAVVPAAFDISARGKLQPSERWDIFAPQPGTVITTAVQNGQQVNAGDLLLQLSNTDIEVQLTELLGRQRVAQEQLESSQRAILDSGRGGRPRLTVAEENRLGGDILQLRQTLLGLAEEIELAVHKHKSLAICAEHAGEVVTWQVEQKLLRRPVQPGQALLTIVNPAGPWELELYLPERRLKHVDAMGPATQADPLQVTFMLSTLPGREFQGSVIEIERSAEVRGEEGSTVLVRVSIDASELPPLRSDTTVTAKLHCGHHALGYVWFCDLIETVQTSVLFWL